jgi:LemA protein
MLLALGIISGIALVVVFWAISLYNGLVGMRNRYKNSFSQIDVQLKRRYDLIPNLVETAKAYLSHEKGTLEAVIAARNSASAARQAVANQPDDANAVKNLRDADAGLTSAMTRFTMLSESYPELKGNTVMTQLSEELASTENKIAFARQAYNDGVMEYNNRREMFPSSIFATAFSFGPAEMFEVASPQERDLVKVKF